jgi:dihydroflavonol-4-reductase
MSNPVSICVTGATGFLGAWIVEALVSEGHRVRVTYRERSRLEALGDLDVEPVKANTLDPAALRRALRGCDVLFHVAGVVGATPADRVFAVNAAGPRLAVEAAAAEGVGRVVLTSSVAAVGPAPPGKVADEDQQYRAHGQGMTYVDAKHEGEAVALGAAARTGIELVVTNPSYVLGPGCVRHLPGETSTRLVANYLRGRLPGVADSGTNIVDVRDVARGHLLAWRKGRAGERYILGGENAQWSRVMGLISEISGVRHPIVFIPREVAPAARRARRLRVPTPISFEAVQLMTRNWQYSSAKAKRELGYEARSLEETLRATVEWSRELIDSGRLEGGALSPIALMSAGVGVADRLGAGRALRAAQPLLRRLVG